MRKLYIFGAGNNGNVIYKKLAEYGIDIEAFIDNNVEKHGKKIGSKDCISISEAIGLGARESSVLVSPYIHEEIEEQLRNEGFLHIYPGYNMFKFIPEAYDENDYGDGAGLCPFRGFESPYPNLSEIHEKEDEIFDKSKKILEIDFNLDRQFELADMMKALDIIDWTGEKSESNRYYYTNEFYPKGSADILHYMMRILKPKKIIEVGSGFSTAVMLDTNEKCFDNSIEIISIEPYADRLKTLLKAEDNIEINECFLQDIPLSFFEQLGENDILFIDSSHVSRINSDVNYIFFEILPRLKKGVYVHFHDIFYPFIYPKKWIYQGRVYNEMYILRAFLMNNNKYSVQFFGEMLEYNYKEKLCDKLIGNCSGNIWIRKEKE
ncbi:MAG: class I SAM-dependent methyltransferase [Blautia sp.]|nr:class I SAM-dependent methyltransferase [Blautia sp.]